ncbi:MAG: WD40 repeat domain-containing protein, partial [Gemmataceae bacterium]
MLAGVARGAVWTLEGGKLISRSLDTGAVQKHPFEAMTNLVSARVGETVAVVATEKTVEVVQPAGSTIFPIASVRGIELVGNQKLAVLKLATGHQVLRLGEKPEERAIGKDATQVGADAEGTIWNLVDNTVRILETPTKEASLGTMIRAGQFLPSGAILATVPGRGILQFPADGTGPKVVSPLQGTIDQLTATSDEKIIAALVAGAARCWQQSGTEIVLPKLPSPATTVAFSHDRKTIAVGLTSGAVFLIDLATGTVIEHFPGSTAITRIVPIPNNPAFLVGTAEGNSLLTMQVARWLRTPKTDHPLLFGLPNGNTVILNDGQSLVVWNVSNGQLERSLELPTRQATINKAGTILATVGPNEPGIVLTNVADGKTIAMLPTSPEVRLLTFNSSGTALFGMLPDRTVVAWNIAFTAGQPLPNGFGQVLQKFPHSSDLTQLAPLADGSTLATVGSDGGLRIWRLAGDTPRKTITANSIVDCVAYSPDGTKLAIGCHDGTLRIYDSSTAAQIKSIAAHTLPIPAAIYCIAWTADSKSILTGSFDRSIKAWNIETGMMVREFPGGAENS